MFEAETYDAPETSDPSVEARQGAMEDLEERHARALATLNFVTRGMPGYERYVEFLEDAAEGLNKLFEETKRGIEEAQRKAAEKERRTEVLIWVINTLWNGGSNPRFVVAPGSKDITRLNFGDLMARHQFLSANPVILDERGTESFIKYVGSEAQTNSSSLISFPYRAFFGFSDGRVVELHFGIELSDADDKGQSYFFIQPSCLWVDTTKRSR